MLNPTTPPTSAPPPIPPPIPLYRTITTLPHKRQSTYHQFCLDIKRQTLLVNGRPDAEHAIASESTLYAWMVNLFSDETVGLWFAYWCTQTALASVYQEMMMYLNRPDTPGTSDTSGSTPDTDTPHGSPLGEALHEPPSTWTPCVHLLDDGRQRIDICTESQEVEMVDAVGGDAGVGVGAGGAGAGAGVGVGAGGAGAGAGAVDVDDPMMGSWSFATVVKREPMLHLTKPFRVFRQEDWGGGGSESGEQVVCRYMLHVWVYGCAARLGSYRVVWEEVGDEE